MSIIWVNDHSAYTTQANALIQTPGASNSQEWGWNVTDKFRPLFPAIGRNTERWEDQVACWGADNLKPLHLLKLLSESNINPQLLWTKVDFALGEGIYTYKQDLKKDERTGELVIVREPVRVPEIERYFRTIKVNALMRARATDYYFAGNVFSKLVLARDPERYGIAHIDHIHCIHARAEMENPSRREVEHYYICGDWMQPSYNKEKPLEGNVRKFKAFSQNDPLAYFRTIQHSKIYWPGQVYYGVQPWHSAGNWIGFANKIPIWMDSNISNSYNIKYHIEYPSNYFDYVKGMSMEEQQVEKERVFDEMDKWLAGERNAGKTFFSKTYRNPLTDKDFSEWKITPITTDIQDNAFVQAYTASNSAMTSAWGIDPSLASIQRDGKFAASGSEMRISYQLHIALKVQAARSIMVEPLEIVRDVNGWDPEIQFGFINKNVVTLAENPSGIESPTNKI